MFNIKQVIFIFCIAIIFSIVLFFKQNEERFETSCIAKRGYVFVESDVKGGGNKVGFIFDRKGITFRVKPIHYAKPYSHISSIYFDELSGVMSIQIQTENEKYFENVGVISKECWSSIVDVASPYTEAINVNMTWSNGYDHPS